MLSTYSLKKLFSLKSSNSEKLSLTEQLVSDFLANRPLDFDPIIQFISSSHESSQREFLKKCRALLAFNLIAHMRQERLNHTAVCADLIRKLSQNSMWMDFQPIAALMKFNTYFVGVLDSPIQPRLYGGGAAHLDWREHWGWSDIPSSGMHAELGLLWATLGKLKGDHNLLLAAIQVAEWQLNTLDAHFFPFISLFTRPSDVSLTTTLSYNYLLFHAVASLADRPEMQFIADKQLEHLIKISEEKKVPLDIPPLALLLEEWCEIFIPTINGVEASLSENILDPSLALIGYRSERYNIVSTLFGGHTGMGGCRFGEIEIVNYGPQLLPLNLETAGFGIDKGGSFMEQKPSEIQLRSLQSGFEMRGETRLASHPAQKQSHALFRRSKFSGTRMEALQTFQDGIFRLKVNFLGLIPLSEIAFVFYIKARSYTEDPIVFKGLEDAISIKPLYSSSKEFIKTLDGSDSVWGANYLLAFYCDSSCNDYGWEISHI